LIGTLKYYSALYLSIFDISLQNTPEKVLIVGEIVLPIYGLVGHMICHAIDRTKPVDDYRLPDPVR